MAYKIEGLPLNVLIDDNRLKLPRFQRKSTWTNKQNFKLCISVFKEFPLGVVIINKEQNINWLLDGRQRRTALKLMKEDPTQVYEWALSFLKFKKTADEQSVRDTFWRVIEEYLQTDKAEKQDEESQDEEEIEETPVDNSFDPAQQQKSLSTLLDLITMIHQRPAGKYSKWERSFDFVECFNRLPYAPNKQGIKRIDPKLLKKFILESMKSMDISDIDTQLTKEKFQEFILENHDILDGKKQKFLNGLTANWELIKKSYDIIARAEIVFESSRIGVITLSNATVLDAQNIFSLVNDGGTKLKAEELLSAKPFWNVPVFDLGMNMKRHINELYQDLGVEQPNDNVKWDICAVILNMIDNNHLIFKDFGNDSKISLERITLGFKLVSTIFVGGMSNKYVSELEKEKIKIGENDYRAINWEQDINELIVDLNQMIRIIESIEYFQYLHSWKKSIMELVGNAAALEFIAISYKNWISKNKPTNDSGEYKSFKRDVIKLFDRLVYEYVLKLWRGSGDSRMASDIKNWQSRLDPVEYSDWERIISQSMTGLIGGSKTTVELLKPILYHYNSIRKCSPITHINTVYEADHIFPQELFVENSMLNQDLKDSLGNLSLLPKQGNISKGSKKLNEINQQFLKDGIKKYAEINESDFDKYSDVTYLEELIRFRKEKFLEVFSTDRVSLLSNN